MFVELKHNRKNNNFQYFYSQNCCVYCENDNNFKSILSINFESFREFWYSMMLGKAIRFILLMLMHGRALCFIHRVFCFYSSFQDQKYDT